MADTTTRNNVLSRTNTIAAAGTDVNLTFSNNNVSPVQWLVISNDTAETFTVEFGTSGYPGGLILPPNTVSPVLPGPWFGFWASHTGGGNLALHTLGGY